MVRSALPSYNSDPQTTSPTTDIMNRRVSGRTRKPSEKLLLQKKWSGVISDKDTDASDKSPSKKISGNSTKKVDDSLSKINSSQSTKKVPEPLTPKNINSSQSKPPVNRRCPTRSDKSTLLLHMPSIDVCLSIYFCLYYFMPYYPSFGEWL